jgi:hypothetical protein
VKGGKMITSKERNYLYALCKNREINFKELVEYALHSQDVDNAWDESLQMKKETYEILIERLRNNWNVFRGVV